MAIKRYTKQAPAVFRSHERVIKEKNRARRIFFLHQAGPFFLVLIGFLLLLSVALPFVFGQFLSDTNLQADAQEELPSEPTIKPVKREQLLPTPFPTPVVIATELAYTDLAEWFPENSVPLVTSQEAKKYLLSIPKLGIIDAEVVYGGRNLDQHLIQYPETGMPGELGSPVIFGHSILRQFYNPKIDNPRRYISIFSTIMTLKKGDPIFIRDDTITYTYRVSDKMEVQPTDTYILQQQPDVRQLKLVTCTPEGTTLRRGVVTATLEE